MNETTVYEFTNFLIAVKQFCKAVSTELPRFKGMAEYVVRTANDLRQCLSEECISTPNTTQPNDMREACEAAYDLIEGLVDGAPDASPLSKQANFVAAQLQNALAKAGGGA